MESSQAQVLAVTSEARLFTSKVLFNRHWHNCSRIILQQLLPCPFKSRWLNCSTVASTIVQQLLARFCNGRWHNSSAVTRTIFQQSLAQLFHNCWQNLSTVADTIVQQSLARLVNSHWHDSSTVKIIFIFSVLAIFFNSGIHIYRIVPCTTNTTHYPHHLPGTVNLINFGLAQTFQIRFCI